MLYNLLCLTENTRFDQEESNGPIFLTLLKAIKGKIIVNAYWVQRTQLSKQEETEWQALLPI